MKRTMWKPLSLGEMFTVVYLLIGITLVLIGFANDNEPLVLIGAIMGLIFALHRPILVYYYDWRLNKQAEKIMKNEN